MLTGAHLRLPGALDQGARDRVDVLRRDRVLKMALQLAHELGDKLRALPHSIRLVAVLHPLAQLAPDNLEGLCQTVNGRDVFRNRSSCSTGGIGGRSARKEHVARSFQARPAYSAIPCTQVYHAA